MMFLDDLVLMGPPKAVGDEAAAIAREAREIRSGLEFKPSKCVAWSKRGSDEARGGLRLSGLAEELAVEQMRFPECDEGITLLGAPIGPHDFVGEGLQERLQENERGHARLRLMKTVQAKLLLLRYCALPQSNHSLRMVPPEDTREYATNSDRQILESVAKAQGFSGPAAWRQIMKLPRKWGGAGFTSAEELAPLAYLASVADALRLYAYVPDVVACIAMDIARWTSDDDPGPDPPDGGGDSQREELEW